MTTNKKPVRRCGVLAWIALRAAVASMTITTATVLSANDQVFLDRVVADDDIIVTSNLWYGTGDPDATQPLYLDAYEPVSSTLPSLLPALVYVHGGAFTQGDKADQPAPLYSMEFARRGYVVFSINYTLDGTVGSASLDTAEAVRWVRANADTFNIDPDRIMIGGHSAGAATALNVGVLEAEDLGGPNAEVAAILNCAGGGFVDLNEVDAGDPPIFIVNGTLDQLAPVTSADALAARLDTLANPVENFVYPYSYMRVEGAGHSFIPGTGTGQQLPLLIASPQDQFQGWSNTEIDGTNVETHVFEFFYEHLHLAELTGQTSDLVVFGDSWADIGNYASATATVPGAPPTYFDGRFSDGEIWVDFLDPTAVTSQAGGTVYATGYALLNSNSVLGNGFTIAAQVSAYLASDIVSADDQIVLAAGFGDVLTTAQSGGTAATALGGLIGQLQAAGIEDIVVVNAVPLGLVPALAQMAPAALLNSATEAWNASLATIPGITIADINTLFAGYVASGLDPSAVALTDGLMIGDDTSSYLWWDTAHPVSRVQAGIADVIAAAIAAQYTTGLRSSDAAWIGAFESYPSGWVNHSTLGWLYVVRESAQNVWMYSQTYGEWHWTNEDVFPTLWSESLGWLYYLAAERPASNWFYVFKQGSWIRGDEWMVTEMGIGFVRTPDYRFRDLPDWPYDYRYVEIDGLRQAYAEAGPSDGPVVLLLHGQPTWSYLYRKMIPVLAEAGYRVIAMDHLGMGRSDKPIDIDDYTYLGHNDRLEKFIQALALQDINLFVQDWGSLIGLRVAGLNPEWFASIAVGNGALPAWPAGTEVHPVVENPDEILDIAAPYALIPDQQPLFYNGCQRLFPFSPDGFADWMEFAMKSSQFVPSGTVEAQTWFPISAAVEAAYDAPFPSRLYMAGTRKFPSLVNEVPGTTDDAWVGLSNFTRPFVTIWASNDIGEMGSCEAAQIFIDGVPGAAGQPHVRLPESSHFLQDDQGGEIARRLVEFYLLNGIDPVTVDPLE